MNIKSKTKDFQYTEDFNILREDSHQFKIEAIDKNGIRKALKHVPSLRNKDISLVVPKGIQKIDSLAFDKLVFKHISLPSSLLEIGTWAFSGSTVINLKLPVGLLTIEEYAFYDCKYLESIEIPDTVTKIGRDAFGGCSSLKLITIPDGVTELGDLAFFKCQSLILAILPDQISSVSLISIRCPYIKKSEYSALLTGFESESQKEIIHKIISLHKSEPSGCLYNMTKASLGSIMKLPKDNPQRFFLLNFLRNHPDFLKNHPDWARAYENDVAKNSVLLFYEFQDDIGLLGIRRLNGDILLEDINVNSLGRKDCWDTEIAKQIGMQTCVDSDCVNLQDGEWLDKCKLITEFLSSFENKKKPGNLGVGVLIDNDIIFDEKTYKYLPKHTRFVHDLYKELVIKNDLRYTPLSTIQEIIDKEEAEYFDKRQFMHNFLSEFQDQSKFRKDKDYKKIVFDDIKYSGLPTGVCRSLKNYEKNMGTMDLVGLKTNLILDIKLYARKSYSNLPFTKISLNGRSERTKNLYQDPEAFINPM